MTSTFYTVADLVTILKLSKSQLYNLIESGKLGCHRFTRGRNGAIRVSQAQLDEFLKATEDYPGVSAPAPVPPQRPASVTGLDKQFTFLTPRS